ncbi:FMN-dependent NADH-azoreductase [Halioxenophilus aromaticivorans]|uniref:FMN dependent NADH:quinone oxidoreductase n=1 Tax=Halioxenophilus aromaticivorans TaxID=1306992 RepID=A0AAV3U097_9ALTE
MKNVLLVTSSLLGDNSTSTNLSNALLDKLSQSQEIKIQLRDLAETNLPHLTQVEMGAWATPAEERSQEQANLAAVSDGLIDELKQADAIIFAVPMYNFGIPSSLKAYFDRVARAGVTFKYTEQGSVGLLESKPVAVVCARGGFYQGTDADSQTPYLKSMLGFIGYNQLSFVFAEGLATPERDNGLAKAQEQIENLSKTLLA